ncbi:glycosyltransferase [Faunimonas sp. B44]|uniref:glycosyltransferase n=1 Tax=Faunimonas sp. B44 TaxID=3461493 RepID=UPI0040442312
MLLFDELFYLERNGDVREKVSSGGGTALEHFMNYGRAEGRAPNPHTLRDHRGEIERVFVFGRYVFLTGWLDVPLADTDIAAVSFGGRKFDVRHSAFQYRRLDVCEAVGAPPFMQLGYGILTKIETEHLVSDEFSFRADGYGRKLHPQYFNRAGDFLDEVLKYFSNFQRMDGDGRGLYRVPRTMLKHLQALFSAYLAENEKPAVRLTSEPVPQGRKCAFVFVQCGPLPLLPAVFHYLRSTRFPVEVIIVNNSRAYREHALSTLAELSTLLGVPWRYLEFARNIGFSSACNAAAAETDAEFVCFHNNDVFTAEPADYDKVIQALEDNPRQVLGVRQRFPSGGLMHDGLQVGVLDPVMTNGAEGILSGVSVGRGAPPGRVFGPTFTSGSFLAVGRDLFLSIGGFSGEYLFGHFEDLDLCLRLAEEGAPTAILKDVSFIHSEGGGSAVPEHITRTVPMLNRLIFTEKWSARLAPLIEGETADA